MALNGNELARRSGGAIQMRAEPLRLRVRLSDIATSDVHCVDLAFSCAAMALDRRGEREMFAEVFLTDREAATIDDVAAHFSDALKLAAADVLATQGAEHWIVDANRAPIVDAMRAAGQRLAFACGVELLPPFDVAVSSPSLNREKLEATGRKLSERRTAGQVEHVQRAAELLKQFESLRQAMPTLSPGELLARVGDGDRGSMLQSLLMASTSGATALLWAVAGPNLVRIDPRESPVRTSLIELPTDLGPLRSVRADGDRLLIGAQSGVMIVNPRQPGDAAKFRDPAVTSQLGFNSVVRAGELIWATHGEAGTVGWNIDKHDEPAFTARPRGIEPGSRNATPLNERMVLYSVAGHVYGADATGPRIPILASGNAPVMTIAAERDRILVVRSDGRIDRMRNVSFEPLDIVYRGSTIRAAAPLPFLGSKRLLLVCDDGPVQCVGDDDPLVTQYLSPHKGLRAIAACADMIAALSADRQRLVLWQTWAADKPLAEIHIGSLARHRAADLCFA